MDMVLFSQDYFDFRGGFGDGIADFIINGIDNYDFIDTLTFDSVWDYGYFAAICYCIEYLISDTNLDLSIINDIINEYYVQFIGEYNKLYNETYPAYTLLLNFKK